MYYIEVTKVKQIFIFNARRHGEDCFVVWNRSSYLLGKGST